MEKDPEIAVITALLGVLASYEWKKLSDCAQLRVLEVFHARRCEDQASKSQKPAPPEQATYRKYEDLLDNSELKKLADMPLGPGKDDYGRKPKQPFDWYDGIDKTRPLDITCQGGRANPTPYKAFQWGRNPGVALTMTSSTSFSNNPIALPPSTLTVTDGKGQQNLGLSYLEDC